jgi:hypothetical protein
MRFPVTDEYEKPFEHFLAMVMSWANREGKAAARDKADSMRQMVGTTGLEPATSTVSR